MIRLPVLRLAIACMRMLYALLKQRPVRDKVVLISRQSDTPSRDFALLAEELRRQDPAVEVIMLCRAIGGSPLERMRYLGDVLVQMRHLADSRVCIVDGYVIPVSVLSHRPELTVIQMWHALGAIKKFGYQCLGKPGGRSPDLAETMQMHKNYDFVLCGGPAAVPVFAEAFGVEPSHVLPLGLPRIDHLLERERQTREGVQPPAIAELLTLHPVLADSSKTTVLYAPTFRRGHATSLDELADHFDPTRYTIVMKLHCLECARVENAAHLVDATGIGVLDLLPLCDVVITDYSAVAFEAYTLDKPVYYYVYDIDAYQDACGLNLDPRVDAPSVTSTNLSDIERWIDADEYDAPTGHRMTELYLPDPIEGSTARIADLVLKRVHGGAER